MDGEQSQELTAGAEAAFASFILRLKRGEGVDFDSYCQERPNLEDSLRRLHTAWIEQTQPHPTGGQVGSIRQYLSERLPEADPNISLDPDTPEGDKGSGVRDRIQSLATRSGRYTLRGEVARGGMGVILKVWDQDLRRTLAMKTAFGTVNPEDVKGSADVEQVSRFLEEAQITGQLDHPGIVPVHELGVDDEGHMFFTMRLVKGRTFDEVIKLARDEKVGWSQPRAVDVMVRICEAMAYAHSKGVIHRDLKPANIMVGKFGEVYVMDWGLAKVIGRPDSQDRRIKESMTIMRSMVHTDRVEDLSHTPDSPLVTLEGTIIGTPTYMPPEQAEGRIDQLDPRSDVYSAGALLYTLLSGRMPYVDPDKHATLGTVLNKLMAGPPTPIADIDKTVPAELVAICEKAMARDPDRRYETMIRMAEDLRAYIDGRVVRAHKTGAVAEFRKWVQRNKGIAAAVGALFLVVVGGALFAAWQQKEKVAEVEEAQELTDKALTRAELNEKVAVRNADTARVNADRAERQSYLAMLAAAHASLRVHETREAKHLLANCPEELRGWEWRYLDLAADTSRKTLDAHTDKVTAVAFSLDGRRIASGSTDKTVRLWDGKTGALLFTLPELPDPVTAIVFSPDGDRVAAASRDMLVRIWDAEGTGLLGTLPGLESVVTSIAFSPDGARIATGSDEGVHLWDAKGFQKVSTLEHDDTVHAVAFSPDGARLVSGTDEGLHVFELTNGQQERKIPFDDTVTCIAYGAAGIAAGSQDATLRLMDPVTGGTLQFFVGHADPVAAVAFAEDGKHIVSSSFDKTVRVWDPESDTARAVLMGHDEAVLSVDTRGDRIVSGSADGTLRLWDVEGGEAVLTLRGGEEFLTAVVFSPQGTTVAAASAGGEIHIWDPRTGHEILEIPEGGGGLSALAFSADGKRLVAGGEEDAIARVLDAATGRGVQILKGHEASVSAVGFSADGQRVVTGSADNSVRVWETVTGKELKKLEAHEGRVTAVAFSTDGKLVLSASRDGTARLWNAATGEQVRVLEGHEGPVLAAVFAPGCETVVTSGADKTVRFWDRATGAAGPVVKGHAGAVSCLAFDEDGTRLVSGGRDKTVRVWDAATGDSLLRLLAHDGWVSGVAFSPDGTQIASASYDTTAKIWRTSR